MLLFVEQKIDKIKQLLHNFVWMDDVRDRTVNCSWVSGDSLYGVGREIYVSDRD